MEEAITIKSEQIEIEIEPFCYEENTDSIQTIQEETYVNITQYDETIPTNLIQEISEQRAEDVQMNLSNDKRKQDLKIYAKDVKNLQPSNKHMDPGEHSKQIPLAQSSSSVNHKDQLFKSQLIKDIGYVHVLENDTYRFACHQCGKTFKNPTIVKRHIKYVHDTDQTVECQTCQRSFKSILYLRSHIRSVHAKIENLKCPHCDKVCLTNKKLKDHLYYTHKTEEDKVNCQVCGKEFKGPYNLKLHMKYVHVNQTHTCHICQKSFKVDMLLQRHIKWAHPSDGIIYKCQICNKILSSIDAYRTHMKRVHLYNKVTCDLCKLTFKSKHILERHLANVHYGKSRSKTENIETKAQIKIKKEFQCQFCDRNLANSTSLYWHIERFHSQKQDMAQTVCEICNKELSDYAALHRHLQAIHAIETATCKICSKEFKSPINLQNHIRVTHAPAEAVQTCDICKKTFKCSLHLRMHVLTVHDGGTYTCEICQKTFSSSKYLGKHLKTHNESRDFKCDICSKSFKELYSVNKHKRIVHDRVKCDICNLKQDNIEEHMRMQHPQVEYMKLNEPQTSLNVMNGKPKRKRNTNKKANTNTRKKQMDLSVENASLTENSSSNMNEVHSDVNLNEAHTNKVKIEIVNDFTCDICNKTFDSSEFDEHTSYCNKPPILEVIVKKEIKEEII